MSIEVFILFSVVAILYIAAFGGIYYLYRTCKGITCTDAILLEASEVEVLDRSMELLRLGQSTYRYVDTVVSENGRCIDTRIRPMSWPWLLSTAFRIELDHIDGMTRITATTQSQKFIRGDLLGFYGGYIQDFLGAVSARA